MVLSQQAVKEFQGLYKQYFGIQLQYEVAEAEALKLIRLVALTQPNPSQDSDERKNRHSFAERWSEAIEEHGFTSLPNLLIFNRKQLGVSAQELFIIIVILSFKWDARNPWPSIKTLAHRSGYLERTVRGHLSSLEQKGLVRRAFRTGLSSEYDFRKLIIKLDGIAVSCLPPGKNEPPREAKTMLFGRNDLTAKEDLENQDARKETSIKRGVEKFEEIASRKYATPP